MYVVSNKKVFFWQSYIVNSINRTICWKGSLKRFIPLTLVSQRSAVHQVVVWHSQLAVTASTILDVHAVSPLRRVKAASCWSKANLQVSAHDKNICMDLLFASAQWSINHTQLKWSRFANKAFQYEKQLWPGFHWPTTKLVVYCMYYTWGGTCLSVSAYFSTVSVHEIANMYAISSPWSLEGRQMRDYNGMWEVRERLPPCPSNPDHQIFDMNQLHVVCDVADIKHSKKFNWLKKPNLSPSLTLPPPSVTSLSSSSSWSPSQTLQPLL